MPPVVANYPVYLMWGATCVLAGSVCHMQALRTNRELGVVYRDMRVFMQCEVYKGYLSKVKRFNCSPVFWLIHEMSEVTCLQCTYKYLEKNRK